MAEDYQQEPLFDLPEARDTKSKSISDRITALIDEHATVIDLIDLTMQMLANDEMADPRYQAEWNRLSDQLIDHNSPVIMFLVRLVAELLLQTPVGREEAVARLRKVAVDRLDYAERVMKARGY